LPALESFLTSKQIICNAADEPINGEMDKTLLLFHSKLYRTDRYIRYHVTDKPEIFLSKTSR